MKLISSLQIIMAENDLSPLVTLFVILVGVVVLVGVVAVVINHISRRAYRDNYDLLREQVRTQDRIIDGLKSQMTSALTQYSKQIEELREEVEVLRWYVTEEGLPVPKDRRHAAELMARRKDEIEMAKRLRTEIIGDDFDELHRRSKALRFGQDPPLYEQEPRAAPATQSVKEPRRKM